MPHIIVSMETRPYCAANITEGAFNVPACKLNDEIENPAVKVVLDARRTAMNALGAVVAEQVSSAELCFGKNNEGGLLVREAGEQIAAFIPKRRFEVDMDDADLLLKLVQATTLNELKAISNTHGVPPANVFPTRAELEALYQMRVERDREWIEKGNKLWDESRGRMNAVPDTFRDAALRLGVSVPWQSMTRKEQVDAQRQTLASKRIKVN